MGECKALQPVALWFGGIQSLLLVHQDTDDINSLSGANLHNLCNFGGYY